MRRAVVVMILFLAGPAAASRLRFVIGQVPLEVSSVRVLRAEQAPGGVVLLSPRMPEISVVATAEACEQSNEKLELDVPRGYFVRDGEAPARSWRTLCVEGDGITVDVSIEDFDPVHQPQTPGYVREVLSTLIRSLRPPIDLAPRITLHRTAFGPMVREGEGRGEVIYEGVSYTLSTRQATCPRELRDPRSVCRELSDRAAIVEVADAGGAPAIDADFADALLALAESAHGRVLWLADRREAFRPRWANGELPLARLPGGRWKLASREHHFELHDIDSGAQLKVSRTSCTGAEAARAPVGAVRIVAPRFVPAPEAWIALGAPWIATACFPLLGADVAVRLQLPVQPDPRTARAYAQALTEVRDASRTVVSLGLIAHPKYFGVSFDTWAAGRFSGFMQLEVGSGAGDDDTSVRFDLAFGRGISRPMARAGIHAGLGLNVVPIRETEQGTDRSGASLFLEGRFLGALGPLVVHGTGRGTFYFDLDCTETSDPEQSCGPSDSSNFEALFGGEVELRASYFESNSAWKVSPYFGVRYVAVSTGGRTEQTMFGTIGAMMW
jgi:hypothetical protein